MISTLFVAMLGISWQQSRESSKTRDLILETNNLMIQLNNDTRTELRAELKDLGTELRADHKALAFGLGDVRERLARIEGHLGIGVTRPADDTELDE